MKLVGVWALALLTFVAPSARALDLHHVLTGYTVTSWTQGDGFALNAIQALAQDRDGYLWLGTGSGLIRFDGFRFARFRDPSGQVLPSLQVRALTVALDGGLWVAFADTTVVRIRDGHVVESLQQPSLAAINSLKVDLTGSLWAGTDSGVWRLRGSEFQSIAMPSAAPVYILEQARDGGLLAGTAAGLFHIAKDGASVEPKQRHAGIIRGVAVDARGALWTTDSASGFRRDDVPVGGTFSGVGRRILSDSRGNMWVATGGQGAWRLRGAGDDNVMIERSNVLTGLPNDGVWALLEDREGNVWAGTQSGITRFAPHSVDSFVDIGVATAVAADDQGGWAATTTGLVRLASTRSSSATATAVVEPLPSPISALRRDTHGTLWAATRKALFRMRAGQLVDATPADVTLTEIAEFATDPDGSVWVADRALGLVRIENGHATVLTLPENLRGPVTALFRDSRKRTWLAVEGGLLANIGVDGSVQRYTASDGYRPSTVNAISEDHLGNVWVSGNGGLTRISPQGTVTVNEQNGLPNSRVVSVVEDRNGVLWAAVAIVGILRIEPSEIEAASKHPGYHVRYRLYDTNDGIAGLPGRSAGSALGPDGRIWFVTGRGVTVVDPDRLRGDAPGGFKRARIEAASAGDVLVETTDGLALPPRSSRLRIDFTAFNLTVPERARFRYRMDGFDGDWVEAGPYRQAVYTNLPPRAYRFQVQVGSAGGDWNGADEWMFSIEPTFYQSWTFIATCLLLGLTVVVGGWRFRVGQMRSNFNLVLAERARLSREIHDTLLQNMVGVLLKIGSVADEIPPSPARSKIESTRRTVEEVIREVQQSIWNLRTSSEGRSIIERLEDLCRRSLDETGIGFAVEAAGTPRPVDHEVELHILRIAQEALSNITRHAQAHHVRLRLSFQSDAVALDVSDDGRGFARVTDAHPSDGHFGLTSMRERCELLGGRFSVTSGIGQGTRIEAILPHP